MEQLNQQKITKDMARRWIATIITNEQSKIEKTKLLNGLDSFDPADDLLQDQATADAWQKIKSDGLTWATVYLTNPR